MHKKMFYVSVTYSLKMLEALIDHEFLLKKVEVRQPAGLCDSRGYQPLRVRGPRMSLPRSYPLGENPWGTCGNMETNTLKTVGPNVFAHVCSSIILIGTRCFVEQQMCWNWT